MQFLINRERRNEMNRYLAVFAVAALAIAVVPAGRAQGSDMKDMDMGKDKKSASGEKKSQAQTHKASGTVTKVDRAGGKVTIAHGAVQTLKWSAMTMTFAVKDNALFDKLSSGKKVDFEFVQQGRDYLIISAK
jgi:Cu(I)/Ag(I) efflux system protein CusF